MWVVHGSRHANPTASPSVNPTDNPTGAPSGQPTANPTSYTTTNPTANPTAAPSATTTVSFCESILCPIDCTGDCGWSRNQNGCRLGGRTIFSEQALPCNTNLPTSSPANIALAPTTAPSTMASAASCEFILCPIDCTGDCGWSQNQNGCRLGGRTTFSEHALPCNTNPPTSAATADHITAGPVATTVDPSFTINTNPTDGTSRALSTVVPRATTTASLPADTVPAPTATASSCESVLCPIDCTGD